MKAGHFRFKNVSTGDLNRPRSPEVRKPLACFLVTFCTTQKVTIRSLCREYRGSANLESAHRSDISAPQQLKPFIKEDSRFSKPRSSTQTIHFRTIQLNPSAATDGIFFLLFVKYKKEGKKLFRLSAVSCCCRNIFRRKRLHSLPACGCLVRRGQAYAL